jgi:hypothetical protein
MGVLIHSELRAFYFHFFLKTILNAAYNMRSTGTEHLDRAGCQPGAGRLHINDCSVGREYQRRTIKCDPLLTI